MGGVAQTARQLLAPGNWSCVLVEHRLAHENGGSVVALALRLLEGPNVGRLVWLRLTFSGRGADVVALRTHLRALGVELHRLGELSRKVRAAYGARATLSVRLLDCRNVYALKPAGGLA